PILGTSLERMLARHIAGREAQTGPGMRPGRVSQTTVRGKLKPVTDDPGEPAQPGESLAPIPSAPRSQPAPHALPPGEPPLLDPQVRRSRKVAGLFLELVPAQVESLIEAATRGDVEDVRARSHKLKGGCASVGARRMAELCEAVQHDALVGDVSQAL